MEITTIVQKLLQSKLASIRYKKRLNLLGEDSNSASMRDLQDEIAQSPLVHSLLSEQDPDGVIRRDPYEKWRGAHWVLICMAELAHPPGQPRLMPLKEQVLEWIFSDEIRVRQTPLINGLYRRHASQQGNVLYYLTSLGMDDPRQDRVAADLLNYQWPDGGWNCDKSPNARASSFTHTSIALRALIHYNRRRQDPDIEEAVGRAKEMLLSRQLYLRRPTGEIIRPEFIQLTYPDYHFYTYLSGLKIMVEGGWIDDPRCQPALDLLESQWMPGQGIKLEKKYFHHRVKDIHRCSLARWGEFKIGGAHAFLTVDALAVLKAAVRI